MPINSHLFTSSQRRIQDGEDVEEVTRIRKVRLTTKELTLSKLFNLISRFQPSTPLEPCLVLGEMGKNIGRLDRCLVPPLFSPGFPTHQVNLIMQLLILPPLLSFRWQNFYKTSEILVSILFQTLYGINISFKCNQRMKCELFISHL